QGLELPTSVTAVAKVNGENVVITITSGSVVDESIVIKAPTVVTEASVSNLEEFKSALSTTNIITITLNGDISNVSEKLIVDRVVTVDGNGHTISYTDAINSATKGSRHGIAVMANGVTIKNLKIQMTEANEWQGTYALQVYNATGVTLENFSGTGADAALLVNAAEVTIAGTTTVSGNEFGGIEVSRGEAVGLNNAKLTVNGTLVNTSESYGKPTIWVEGDQGTVDGAGVPAFVSSKVQLDQTQYYLTDQVNVSSFKALQAALSNADVMTIKLTSNIDGVAERLIVDRAVTVDGNGHTISYTDAINSATKGSRHGIAVMANGVMIKNLKIQMTEANEWQGTYALQVYNATGVTLENFSGTGADAALLVNAAEVTIAGTTTVSGNEFGGIEVSRGEAVGLNNAKLTVNGTLVNTSESYGKPTIWVEGDQGTVDGTGVPAYISKEVKEGQTQYYQTDSNTTVPSPEI
ncbi:pectate lyase-like adhesive domain-containing protein, partial [Paenibacillus sp. GCM10028914]|uniref:pectate lyase-like adhesive domain-containing protein n=1 Tax=Paenibacillus sp. GCM10028914 TaxID=3273416 RepID=UPI00360AFE50